jgi:hypothetical protein
MPAAHTGPFRLGAIAPVPQISADSRWFSTLTWLELATLNL